MMKMEGKLTTAGSDGDPGATITEKEFYKAMQRLKDRGNNAVPPKKSASAYILFGKEVNDPNWSEVITLIFSAILCFVKRRQNIVTS